MSVSLSSYSVRFYIVLLMRNRKSVYSDKHRISLMFVFVFCSHKLQAVSLSTLSIASSSSSFFNQASFWWTSSPWDHLPFLGSCCLKILTDLDCHILGSAGSLLSSVSLSPHIYVLINLDTSLCLLFLCGLPSSRSPGWTGGHVARAPLGDASSCAVVSWIHSLYLYPSFCYCNL